MVNGDVGLSPNPAVFYKLADLNGDLAKGPVTVSFNHSHYQGDITLYHDVQLLQTTGILSLFSKVNWAGLGLNLAKTVIPIIAGAGQ